jgi:hypothetical protein
VDEGCTAPGEDDPPGSARGCTARGCGWSSPTLESMLPLVLLPGFGWGRRRAGRGRI